MAAGDAVVAAARRPVALDDLVAAHPDQAEAITLDVTDGRAAEAWVADGGAPRRPARARAAGVGGGAGRRVAVMSALF